MGKDKVHFFLFLRGSSQTRKTTLCSPVGPSPLTSGYCFGVALTVSVSEGEVSPASGKLTEQMRHRWRQYRSTLSHLIVTDSSTPKSKFQFPSLSPQVGGLLPMQSPCRTWSSWGQAAPDAASLGWSQMFPSTWTLASLPASSGICPTCSVMCLLFLQPASWG